MMFSFTKNENNAANSIQSKENNVLHRDDDPIINSQKRKMEEDELSAESNKRQKKSEPKFDNTILNIIKENSQLFKQIVFQSSQFLGAGYFGQVFLSKWQGHPIAVKSVTIDQKGKIVLYENTRKILPELTALKIPNIIGYYGCNIVEDTLKLGATYQFIYEYQPFGSVDVLMQEEPGTLTWSFCLRAAGQAAVALKYLHHYDFIHTDLTPQNLLVDNDGNVRLADLDLVISTRQKLKNITGMPLFYSPEVLLKFMQLKNFCIPQQYVNTFTAAYQSKKSDVYAFGLLMFCLFSKEKIPFLESVQIDALSEYIFSGQRRTIPSDWSQGIAKLITRCWDAKPASRPAMNEVCEELEKEYQLNQPTKK